MGIDMVRKVASPGSLGTALREARKRKGVSQAEAGKAVGIDQPTVSKLEQGSPGTRLGTLFRLLAALDLELVLQPRSRSSKEIGEEDW